MGRVTVTARIENLYDVLSAKAGTLPPNEVRLIDVSDALIDTGASGLLMPSRMVKQLGLTQFRTQKARGIVGTIQMPVFSVARLTVQGRECSMDVGEIDDSLPVIIGQIPLEAMDWVVDPRGQKLIGNPEHGGEHIIEALGTY